MFAGVDKLGGGVVGDVVAGSKARMITMGESAATASAEETLVGKEITSDGTTQDVLLCSKVDPSGGGLHWLPVDAAIAMKDTTSMSQMTSMLHDEDRNSKYEAAITKAVHEFVDRHGRPPVVLDIGCGTGLLSMLAAKAGATEVYGCEMFKPLASIAREVTELNCPGRVKVLAKKSTELEVGDGKDLPHRADMCVNEIYDSALLGEGCLPALRHALSNLLVDEPVIVPASSMVHGVLLCSASLRARHDLSQAQFSKGVPVARNVSAAKCNGGRKPLPLQGVEVPDAVELSGQFHALEFDFGKTFPEDGCRSRRLSVRVKRDGVLDAVRMTWDLTLGSGVTYSTRHGAENWQDHWCPCYFPLAGGLAVRAGDTVRLKVTHSELHIAFEVLDVRGEEEEREKEKKQEGKTDGGETASRERSGGTATPPNATPMKRNHSSGGGGEPNGCASAVVVVRNGVQNGVSHASPADRDYKMEREWDPEPCGCGWHVLCNQERIGMLTDAARREAYRLAVGRVLRGLPAETLGSAVCLDIGDGSTSAFLSVEEGASVVVTYEPAEWSHLLVGQVVRNNDLEDKIHLLEAAEEWPYLREAILGEDVGDSDHAGDAEQGQQEHLLCDVLMGEPFYYRMQSLVLYEAMNFWYLRRLFHPALKPNARVLPMRAIVCVAGVELPDLCLSHGPVGSVLGFDHSPYDKRVRDRWHRLLYPYPLRAYKHRFLTETRDLLSMEYSSLPRSLESKVALPFNADGTIHAVAIWTDYQLDETERWSSFGGSTKGSGGASLVPGGLHEKQMLRFLPQPEHVGQTQSNAGMAYPRLEIQGRFDAEGGCMEFDVDFVSA